MLEQFDKKWQIPTKAQSKKNGKKDTGMLQPEYSKPLHVPSVAARLKG